MEDSAEVGVDGEDLPGTISNLAMLPEHTLIHKKGLAQLFGCSERTIQRAVNCSNVWKSHLDDWSGHKAR
jgi:hypothetical protein